MFAIKIENISKQYRLGEVDVNSFVQDVKRFLCKIKGGEDPCLYKDTNTSKENSEYIWALRDINLEIEQGETIGIVGGNGAGKSTLLKILSRITAPTTGIVHIRGEVSSLLEVGTGFNPEMTGRENVYLNGSILGMTKDEINRKFDDIIEFSGVKRYIDTPVKRYSSGMKVRLAFAVAVHLDSEILIIDEVLAVGDTEFRRKCTEKIMSITQEKKRTVLFVSHDMHTVRQLCERVILLEDGALVESGTADEVIERYLKKSREEIAEEFQTINVKGTGVNITDFCFVQNSKRTPYLSQGERFECEFKVENTDNENYSLSFNVELTSSIGEPITFFGNQFQNQEIYINPKVKKTVKISFSDLYLRAGDYLVNLFFSTNLTKFPKEKIRKENVTLLNIVPPPSSYYADNDRSWTAFSKNKNHAYLPMKIDKWEQSKDTTI